MSDQSIRDDGVARIHDILRSALAEIDRVLTQAGCRYFLAYGTALGARRDGDLIAWDVDADLLLHSEDRPRALAALREGLEGTPFAVEAPGDPDYEYLFPRVVLRGVHHTLVRVDLFPLDAAPDAAPLQWLLTRLLRATNKAHMLKAMDLDERRHYGSAKHAVARVARTLLSVVPLRVVAGAHRAIVAAAGRLGSGRTLVNSSGSYGPREYFPAAWFEHASTLTLASHPFAAPVATDEYLRHVYGDFLTPPAPETIARELDFARRHYVEPLRSAGVVE